MGLSRKQQLWIEYYLQHWNATEAARLVPYKVPRVSGPRNLHNTLVQEAIKARLDEVAMGANEVLHRLAEQARGSLEDFLRFVPLDAQGEEIMLDVQGEPLVKPARFAAVIDLDRAREAKKLRLLHGLKHNRYGWEIELYDAQRALELLGRHHGLFAEHIQHSGEVRLVHEPDLSKLTDEELSWLAAIAERLAGNSEGAGAPELPPVAE